MIKTVTVLVITFLLINLKLEAQLDMAFIANFSAASVNSVNRLSWTVANNQGANSFQVEKSTNGNDFRKIGDIKATEKFYAESYTFSDTISSPDKIMYRLKVLSKTQRSYYSRIILVQPKMAPIYGIKIIGNPAKDKFCFSYNSINRQQAAITIYNLRGNVLFTQKMSFFIGNNLITIPLNSGFIPGVYVIKMNTDIFSQTEKFIKQ